MYEANKKIGRAPKRLRTICLAVLGTVAQGAVLAQDQKPSSAIAPTAAPAVPSAAPTTVPVPATAPSPKVAAAPVQERHFDINEYIVRGNTVLDARTIEKTVMPFLGPQRTKKDAEAARDALLAVYQANGYQSVYVELPEQQATDGIVFLQVTETKVGRVRVVGAKYNSPAEMRDQVPSLGEGSVPNFTLAQAELTTLNRGAKRQVMPLVKQGKLPGTMDVDLKVEDESPWRGSISLNNDHSADTSKLRATATIAHDNLWQLGHSASISFFGAPEKLDQTKVWSASYSAPLPGSNWALEMSGYKSNSSVSTVGGTNVLGNGHSVGLKAIYTAPNSGDWWHSFSSAVDFKSTMEAIRLSGNTDTVPIKYAPITLAYSGFMQNERAQFGLGLSLVAGTRGVFGYGGSDWKQFDYKRYKATPSFMYAKIDVNGSYNLGSIAQFGYRLSGQITDSPLVSGEQIAAGGMNSVRGYLSAEATGDYGVVGSIELRSKQLTFLNPWVNGWRIYVFADAARLLLRDPLPEQKNRFMLASVGIGTNFRLGESITGRLDFGYPLKEGSRTKPHDPSLTFNVNASY